MRPSDTTAVLPSLFSPYLVDRLIKLQRATGKSLPRLVREAISLYLARHGHLLDDVPSSAHGDSPLICSPQDAATILLPHVDGLARSHLIGLFLNRRGEVRASQVLETGCHNLTRVPIRLVLQPALLLRAKALLLAHNHVDGLAIPSDDDLTFTTRIAHAAQVLGMVLLDHLIVANGVYASLFEEGCIPQHWNGYRGVYRCSVSEMARRSIRNGMRIGGENR